MDVTAKQKVLFNKLKQKVKKLQRKEEQSREKVREALSKVKKIGDSYKITLTRKVREMEHKLARSEVACYLKIAADLEDQLVKGIKGKIKALHAAAKRVQQPASKVKKTTKRTVKKRTTKK